MSAVSLSFHRVTAAKAMVQHAENCQWLTLEFRDDEDGRLSLSLFSESPEALLKALAAEGFKAGVAAAAKLLNDKADAYDAEHGSTDQDTGDRDYPGRGAGLEYHSNLIELAEEVAAIAERPHEKKPALQRIAELLEDGDGPGLHDLLTEDRPRLTPYERRQLGVIAHWAFVEESQVRAAIARTA